MRLSEHQQVLPLPPRLMPTRLIAHSPRCSYPGPQVRLSEYQHLVPPHLRNGKPSFFMCGGLVFTACTGEGARACMCMPGAGVRAACMHHPTCVFSVCGGARAPAWRTGAAAARPGQLCMGVPTTSQDPLAIFNLRNTHGPGRLQTRTWCSATAPWVPRP